MWGDGTSSVLIGNPGSAMHAYANTGNALSQTFTISITATDNSGSVSAPATTTETVNDQPPIAVIVGPSMGFQFSSVTFDGSGSNDVDGTVVAWSWTFGDGTAGSGPIVMHTYASQGPFTVTLTVTDNSGNTGTTTHAITIGPQITQGHASFNGYGAKALYKKDGLRNHPTQSLVANVINDNTTVVTVYVEFQVADGDGVILTLFTPVVSLVPGQIVDATLNLTFAANFNPTVGSFAVTATLFFSPTQSTTIGDNSFMPSGTRTFSFVACSPSCR
jgi:PKD repeat protein